MSDIKEVNDAFEEVVRRNVEAAVAFSNETRRIVLGIEERMKRLEEQARNQDAEMARLRVMLANLQTRIFSGGTG